MHIQNMDKEHGNRTSNRGSYSCVCGSNAPVESQRQVDAVVGPNMVSVDCETTLATKGMSQWELAIGGNP